MRAAEATAMPSVGEIDRLGWQDQFDDKFAEVQAPPSHAGSRRVGVAWPAVDRHDRPLAIRGLQLNWPTSSSGRSNPHRKADLAYGTSDQHRRGQPHAPAGHRSHACPMLRRWPSPQATTGGVRDRPIGGIHRNDFGRTGLEG